MRRVQPTDIHDFYVGTDYDTGPHATHDIVWACGGANREDERLVHGSALGETTSWQRT